MNGTEQKNHRTALDHLGAEMAIAIEGLETALAAERLDRQQGDMDTSAAALANTRTAISDERMRRLTMADEQRAYVDAADTAIKQAAYLLTLQVREFQLRGFWSRFNWLLTGR